MLGQARGFNGMILIAGLRADSETKIPRELPAGNLATSVNRLPAGRPASPTIGCRVYRVRHVELTAFGPIWPVRDSPDSYKIYREDGSCLCEVYLAVNGDAGVAANDLTGYGTICRCDRELALHRPSASAVQRAIDIAPDGYGPPFRARSAVGDRPITIFPRRGRGARRRQTGVTVSHRS
jgi:hypothetical protein